VKLTVVIPIYNEVDNLPALSERLRATFARLPELDHEVVYVNDGSTDDSLALMLRQHREDPRFTVLDLSRNFGHQAAIAAGLTAAKADAVVVMDGDLQDPPEVIPELVAAWRNGAEVVRAQRATRQERGFRRWCFDAFYRLLQWLSDFPIPAQVGVFCLLDRRALEALNDLPERNRYLPGLRAWIGFEQRSVLYDRSARASGAPKQSLARLVRYAVDGILSFSYKPLRLMVATGATISAAGFVLASVFIVKRLTGIETAATGFTTLVTLILFLGGAQLIGIGLVGEYMARIYDEVKQRPLYVVRRQFGGQQKDD
jgi:glycosyltransferase involved in cell wall biosynthesis